MPLAVDVYYYDKKAKVSGVIFTDWPDELPVKIISTHIDHVEEYTSGEFYRRELPCIVQLLSQVDLNNAEVVIIDGYVYLDNEKKPGLGAYLFNYLEGKIPIIGIAKTAFHQNQENVELVYRGESKNPLYVSSVGMGTKTAANLVKNMHGKHRIPTLLKLLDQETKQV